MAAYNLGPFRLKFRGIFDGSTTYNFCDVVTYNGSSYVCNHEDLVGDLYCVGVLPTGQTESETYWQLLAQKGDIADKYDSFVEITDNNWDYSISDKIFIGEDVAFISPLNITNVYDGCCGLISTKNANVVLPENSSYSTDFFYVELVDPLTQSYLYSFICVKDGNSFRYIWHRTVINE